MPFSGNAEVIESKCYRHEDGRMVSLFSSYVPEGFVLTVRGWDIRWTGDGTVGRCKPPFATEAEAIAYATKWNEERATRYAVAEGDM